MVQGLRSQRHTAGRSPSWSDERCPAPGASPFAALPTRPWSCARGLDIPFLHPPDAHSFVSTTVPLNVANSQSVPVKLASIRVAFAVPKLPNVPRHPRGDGNSPWVLIWAGGVLPGVRAVEGRLHGQPAVRRLNRDAKRPEVRLGDRLEGPGHGPGRWRRGAGISRVDLNGRRSAPGPRQERGLSRRRCRRGLFPACRQEREGSHRCEVRNTSRPSAHAKLLPVRARAAGERTRRGSGRCANRNPERRRSR